MIAITHGHDDHVGNTIDLVEKHDCTVVAPVELADWLVWMKKAVLGGQRSAIRTRAGRSTSTASRSR